MWETKWFLSIVKYIPLVKGKYNKLKTRTVCELVAQGQSQSVFITKKFWKYFKSIKKKYDKVFHRVKNKPHLNKPAWLLSSAHKCVKYHWLKIQMLHLNGGALNDAILLLCKKDNLPVHHRRTFQANKDKQMRMRAPSLCSAAVHELWQLLCNSCREASCC